jgi:hypothetical protein
MKKKIIFILVYLVSIATFAQKQGGVISWEKTSFDFGIIKQEDGLVKHKFVFINIGDEPLMIEKVKSTCGCATSNYTKDQILPKAKGFVEVTFDPSKQLGEFTKKITVITNEKTLVSSSLVIQGNVISK